MKPNMIKKWSVALLVAAGAAGMVGCQGVQMDDGTNGTANYTESAEVTESNTNTETETDLGNVPARSLALVQNDVDQSMGDMISPTSGALHVLDGHADTMTGSNEDERLNVVYNAIRDRFDGIYDNTNGVEVRTDVASVTIQNVVAGSTYTVTVTSNEDFAQTNTSTGTVVANAEGMDDVEAEVTLTSDSKLRYTLSFEAVEAGDANIDLKNVGLGYVVAVSEDGGTPVTLTLQDDFAPLVALQHSDRNGQDKTNYNNNVAPHDSVGMLIEFGEQPTDEAGEPINGSAQEFYPKLNLTASLYDECHVRGKSENIDAAAGDAQEPINASELDARYYTTPLLASTKSYTDSGVTYGPGVCPTESSVGTTCATQRSDRFYSQEDYTCWYGTTTTTNNCQVYAIDPGLDVNYYTVSTGQTGGIAISAGDLVGSTLPDPLSTYQSITFTTPVTFGAVQVTTGLLETDGCVLTTNTSDVARNIVVDLTDDIAAVPDSTDTTAIQAAGYITAGTTLAGTSTGLLHLENPAQHAARSVVYHADTAGSTVSDRDHHLIATIGDWREINENSRFIAATQDVITGTTATLYGPRMEYVVNSNVYGPVADDATVNTAHFGLRAEDYVVDSQSDGAVKSSLVSLAGLKDADNDALVIGSGDATGVVLVDATPALATDVSTSATGGTANNINNDGSISFTFDQPVLDPANYPDHAFLDLIGDDFVYRVDLNESVTVDGTDYDATVVRGTPYGGDSGYLNGVAGALDVSESAAVDSNNNANSKRKVGATTIDIDALATASVTLLEGSKVRLTEVDAGTVSADATAGANTITLGDLENGIIAEGSIIQIGNGERAHRYRVVDNTDNDGYVTVASNSATFVITPALRSDVVTGRDVTVEKSSTHVLTANATVDANGDVAEAAIYPSLPSNYGSNTIVTVLNGIVDTTATTTAYVDAFGFSTGEFDTNSVAATITRSNSNKTMTITVADATINTTVAGNVAPNTTTSETVDMGGFFSDLSHTSATSVAGTATTPSFFVNYEDIQDTNYNSWAKVDTYDNYDDGRSPLLVGTDGILPKLQQSSNTGTDDSSNTFLYDVTSSAGITLVAAHGNDGLQTDDDIIYTPGIDGTTYEAATEADFPGADDEDDYPLFWFWGYDSTAEQTKSASTATPQVLETRAVLKLSGVSSIDTSNAQVYMYAPDAVDTDQGDTDSFTTTCTLVEGEVDNYIFATPPVTGLRVSSSASVDSSNPTGGQDIVVAAANGSEVRGLTTATAADWSKALNVDANVNNNLQSDADESALIVGIPAYDDDSWNSPNDTLVIEDVLLDGVPYTLHFKIPQYPTTAVATAGTALVTEETANLPEMFVYRKVSLATVDLTPSGNDDVCSPRNVRTGNLVADDYNPDELQFSYREDLAAAPTVAYRVGTDNDGAVADTDGFSSLFSNPVATLDDNNANQARIRLHDITEATSGYIGHGAQIDVTASDYASKQSAFTITLRLGHGAPNVDDTNGGTGTANVVTDPILNAIGVFGTLNVPMTTTEADANFSTGSNTLGTAVE